MSVLDIKRTKIELLCYGVNCSLDVFNTIREINPYASSNKSVHSAFFLLDDTIWVNTPINEAYTRCSPYSIIIDANQLVLCKYNKQLCKVTILTPPKWYEKKTSNDTKMYDVLSVHNKNVLALTHYTNCFYSSMGKRCLYCSATDSTIPQLLDFETRKQDIVETLIEALQDNSNYSLALSEGVKNPHDRGAVYFSSILQNVLENNIKIESSVELAPPADNSYIDLLHSCGATSIIMNMEFYDDAVRKVYCPGKSEINTEQYFCALSHSVKIFGYGNVASVLIVGIETISNTITCARILLDMGILPILIPFKPYDNCNLFNSKTTNPEDLILVSAEINRYFQSRTSKVICNSTCISCGACSANYYK